MRQIHAPHVADSQLLTEALERHEQLQIKVARALAIDPADHASSSRDYGRGFSAAITLVREALGQ